MDTKNKLPIENINDELFDLETLITEGTEAYIPLKFQYPGTDKVVGVYVKPVTSQEFVDATRGPNNIFIDVLNGALFNNNKEAIPLDIIKKLPAGVVMELYKKIADISAIPLEENEKVTKEMIEKFMGF